MLETQPVPPPARMDSRSLPVADYGLLADCHSAALVSRGGSIDWLCLPRYDSPAVFARLLDAAAGHWSIRPAAPFEVARRYLPGTLVVEPTFTTAEGTLRLTDAMAFAEGQRGHDLGHDAPHELLRHVEALDGSVEVLMELSPRPEYGLVRPLFRRTEDGGRTFSGPCRMAVRSQRDVSIEDATMRAAFVLEAGEGAGFALRWAAIDGPQPEPTAPGAVRARIDDTAEGWRSWEAEHDIYDGPHRDQVRHSARVLKGLTYRPTGAIVAAPTTSLPETVGGERNWDYRFSWIRDSSLTLEALYTGACSDEAVDFVSFMTASAGGAAGESSSLQIMYGIYGELLNALYLYREKLGELHPEIQRFVAELADAAAAGWSRRDQGMWEMRGEPRHHLSSKVLCWVALDRAVKLAPQLGPYAKAEAWAEERDRVRSAILDRGWSQRAGAYAQSFDADELDAAQLLMPVYGFLPATDERMRATIEAIARGLTEDGLVLRYRNDEGLNADGLTGEEGTFVICSFWLVSCLAKAGELERAEALFEQLAAYANDLGLLAEEIDTADDELLGNFPQAFSHIGLINAAADLDRASEAAGR